MRSVNLTALLYIILQFFHHESDFSTGILVRCHLDPKLPFAPPEQRLFGASIPGSAGSTGGKAGGAYSCSGFLVPRRRASCWQQAGGSTRESRRLGLMGPGGVAQVGLLLARHMVGRRPGRGLVPDGGWDPQGAPDCNGQQDPGARRRGRSQEQSLRHPGSRYVRRGGSTKAGSTASPFGCAGSSVRSAEGCNACGSGETASTGAQDRNPVAA